MGTDRFHAKALTTEKADRIDTIRQSFTLLYDHLDDIIPIGREKSLYVTKLEEACMWAVKAVAEERYDVEGEK